MHLTRAYRSLPRPSSKFKPSYPSNSFLGFKTFNLKSKVLSLSISSLLFIYSLPKEGMSSGFLILFSSNIMSRLWTILKLPKPGNAEFGSSSVFLEATLLLHSQKRGEYEFLDEVGYLNWGWPVKELLVPYGMDLPWVEHGSLRCKRSILPLDYRPSFNRNKSHSHRPQNNFNFIIK